MESRDTIFAPATARGKAAVTVLRVSGPASDAACRALCGDLPEPRRAALRTLRDPATGEEIDQALVLRFTAPNSYTGENSLEFQCHGGGAVLSALLRTLAALPGLRLAQPGEFTRRALENDRLDLLEAEAVADLVNADTESQRRQALKALRGALGHQAEGWRAALIRARALTEAVMDFADEEVPENVAPEVSALIASVSQEIARALAGARAAERIRDGFEIALLGPPNAGKSTLLNALARREAALTSEIAGTTRDVIEVQMDLAGLPVTLLDTAGLRDTDDHVESLGIARARQRAEAADLRIHLVPPGGSPPDAALLAPDDIIARTKTDLPSPAPERPSPTPLEGEARGGAASTPIPPISISAKTGENLPALIEAVTARLQTRAAGASAVTTARHREALQSGAVHLAAAATHLAQGEAALDLTAEELRLATRALESLLGRVDAERILDDIFAEFCLGK